MKLHKKLLRKAVGAMLSALIFAGGTLPAFAAPSSMQEKLVAIEESAYGRAQTGSLIDRVNHLESDFTGAHPTESVAARVDSLYAQMFENESGPSIITQMNAVEYAITEELSMLPLNKSVNAMEMNITGKTEEGLYTTRIDQLAGYAFGADPIPLTQYIVPAATLIRIELVSPVNAKNVKVDDIIEIKAAEDIFVDGMLIFPKGTPGRGKVVKVKTAKNFGRDASVEIDFEYVRAFDGTNIKTIVGEEAKQMMTGYAIAAGASVAGMCILGPVGIIGGAFVKGRNIDLPPGTELYVQTKTDTIVYGLEAPAAAAKAAERDAARKAEAEAKAKKKKGEDKAEEQDKA